MKKGQVLEGTIEKVEFPNKGVVTVAEEGKSVIVKNGIPGQKVKFCVNKFKRGNAEGRLVGSAGEISAGTRNRCAAFSRYAEGVCTRPCLMKHRWT